MNYEETLAAEAGRGNGPVMSCELDGRFSVIKVAYLNTQRDLGVILEVFNGTPGGNQKPDPV